MRARTETTAHLDAEIASVDIIPQEEITRGLRISTDLEEFHQIILRGRGYYQHAKTGILDTETHVLPMNIATH